MTAPVPGAVAGRILLDMGYTESSPARRAGRVVVGVTGSPGSRAALLRAVQAARDGGRTLVPVLAWTPAGGEMAARVAPSPSLDELHHQDARARLDDAIRAALGGPPDGVRITPAVVRAPAADALTVLADHPADLLVLGAGPRHRLARLLRGRVRRRVLSHAQAPVLLVRAPALPAPARRVLRRVSPEDFLGGTTAGPTR